MASLVLSKATTYCMSSNHVELKDGLSCTVLVKSSQLHRKKMVLIWMSCNILKT